MGLPVGLARGPWRPAGAPTSGAHRLETPPAVSFSSEGVPRGEILEPVANVCAAIRLMMMTRSHDDARDRPIARAFSN
eukprot:4345533-Pyramimonas_sp.AAC.2